MKGTGLEGAGLEGTGCKQREPGHDSGTVDDIDLSREHPVGAAALLDLLQPPSSEEGYRHNYSPLLSSLEVQDKEEPDSWRNKLGVLGQGKVEVPLPLALWSLDSTVV